MEQNSPRKARSVFSSEFTGFHPPTGKVGDDALGPYVLKVLEALHTLPAEVRVIDAGTPFDCRDLKKSKIVWGNPALPACPLLW